jgi:hypothetical protein
MLHHDFLWETSCFHLIGRDEHRNAETVVGTIQFWGNMRNQPQTESPKKSKKNLGG